MTGNEVVASGFNPASLMPSTLDGKYKMAGILARSGLIPAGLNTPEKVCVALEWGHELQLSPMVAVNNIAVINGKPTLSADIMTAVVKRSPEFGGIKWIQQDERAAECVITRKSANYTEETHSRFTIEDAARAGLTGRDVWKKYTKRMLKHRCLSYGLRDAFPDILAGLYNPEEMESVGATAQYVPTEIPADVVEVTTNVREEPSQNVDGLASAKSVLNRMVSRYANELKGKPYELAMESLGKGDLDSVNAMIRRVTDYLGRQGIDVGDDK